MRDVRFTRYRQGGTARPNLHLIRQNGVVHIVAYTEGPAVVLLCPDGTPEGDDFRMDMRCGKTVKMYCGGRNRITDSHPTCVFCISGHDP